MNAPVTLILTLPGLLIVLSISFSVAVIVLWRRRESWASWAAEPSWAGGSAAWWPSVDGGNVMVVEECHSPQLPRGEEARERCQRALSSRGILEAGIGDEEQLKERRQ
jgi:hypothetical protein